MLFHTGTALTLLLSLPLLIPFFLFLLPPLSLSPLSLTPLLFFILASIQMWVRGERLPTSQACKMALGGRLWDEEQAGINREDRRGEGQGKQSRCSRCTKKVTRGGGGDGPRVPLGRCGARCSPALLPALYLQPCLFAHLHGAARESRRGGPSLPALR